jgi:hypothetical protein
VPLKRGPEAPSDGPDTLVKLVYDLLAAQRETLWLGAHLSHHDVWLVHLNRLRELQSVGHRALGELGSLDLDANSPGSTDELELKRATTGPSVPAWLARKRSRTHPSSGAGR